MDNDGLTPLAGQDFEQAAALPGADAFDATRFRPYLADLGISDEQADELLAILWDIMTRFVDLGWKVDLVCEQVFGEVDLSPDETGNKV